MKFLHFSLPTLVSFNLSYDEIIEFAENLDLILGDLIYFVEDTSGNQIHVNIQGLDKFIIELEAKPENEAALMLS